MSKIRKQLTLFIPQQYRTEIEEIRARFNPIQYNLIAAHITLCREDEIDEIEKVIFNIKRLSLKEPITIELGKPEMFDDKKGVFIAGKPTTQWHKLRKIILNGLFDCPRLQQPHITLMHPRNSNCTESIFNQIKTYPLPAAVQFNAISLIEQVDNGPWNTIANFQIIAQHND